MIKSKKIILFSIIWIMGIVLSGCNIKQTWNNAISSMKDLVWIQKEHSHWAAWELDFNDLLDDVEANQINEQKIINCLNNKWVTFYWWASCWFSCEDVQKYWDKMKNFPCVDCDKNSDLCDLMWITKIPTRAWEWWKKVTNIKSLNDLAIEFGCDE